MFRLMLAFIIFVHGLIHLLGFVKEWQLAQIKQLTGKTLIPLSGMLSKTVGLFWLIGGLLFIFSVAMYLVRKEWWWMIAAVAIIFSQTLIIIYWQDARFGSFVNIIILLTCFLSYGTWNFNKMVNSELHSLLLSTSQEKKVLTAVDIAKLPPVVKKWFERSNIIGKEIVRTVKLEQKGKMKTKLDGHWMPVDAKQYFTVEKPSFIWVADVKVAPFVHLIGRDKYQDGKGNMLIKLLSLFPVANARGKETDQGSLLRYIAEIVWFPSAALSNYITWQEIDSITAKATMSYGGITASGIFKFNADGDVISFEAQRYYNRKAGPTLETWVITIDETSYREFEGVRIPTRSTVTWKLKEGDFTWYELEITKVEYNRITD